MKILILTDSLGLPRFKPELCSFEDTWPILLKDKHPNTHQVSIGAATSQILLKQINYQKAFNPDLIILQVGIVDCAPRFMSRKELDFTNALGNFGKLLRFIMNRNWIKRLRKISFVNMDEFEHNVLKIKSAFNCPIIAIGILPSSNEYEKLLPGVTKKIISYNNILERNFKFFLKTNQIWSVNGIMTDYHHLNRSGHIFIFEKIEEILMNIQIKSEVDV